MVDPGLATPRGDGAFNEWSSLDGVLVDIEEGQGDLAQIRLRELGAGSLTHVCGANPQIAGALAPHLNGGPIRVHGLGCWRREPCGGWTMLHFTVTAFDILDPAPLEVVVQRLRQIPGNG